MMEKRTAGLFDAARSGDLAAAHEILEADPALAAATDEGGITATMTALYHGHLDLARALLGTRDPDVFEAAALGDIDRLQSLLAATPDASHLHSPDGFTALHLAGFFGQVAAARMLLDAGADPSTEARNASRVQPIHSACATGPEWAAAGRLEVARLLLERGATCDARQSGGWTPLQSRCLHGDEAFVALLLSHGADPMQKADNGQTALDMATEQHHTVVVRLLQRAIAQHRRNG
jgi:ankyrin repeat protein